MRDAIYDLSSSISQIVASTHSPYIIDISKKPKQVLNRLSENGRSIVGESFSVTDSFKILQGEDKSYVKMLLKIDDYIARAFFTNNIVIVEGDTEDILIRETLSRLPKDKYLNLVSNFEVIKARGKAAIIGLVKYLTSMGLKPIVVHDRDKEIEGAKKFNDPIRQAVGENGKVVLMHENVEDEIGYAESSEKPFKAYLETQSWGDKWIDVPENWRKKIKEIFNEYVS